MRTSISKTRFQKINLATIILLFVTVLAGGVVRSSGSGMGCPDWPKCFGRFVPPTNSSELPKDYKTKYVARNVAKNQRFANTLDVLGYSDLAKRIRDDRSVLVPDEFNAAKTWTEYVNRLIGIITGFFMILSAIWGFSYKRDNKWIPFLSVANLIIVGFQGWLGSLVVSTNLVPWVVTVHMLLALIIIAIAIVTYHLARVEGRPQLTINPLVHIVTVLALLISTAQIIFGSEVREKIDAVAGRMQGGYRNDWIQYVGSIFTQHRDVAILVLVANIVLYALVRRTFSRHSLQQQIMSFAFLMIMLQIVTGILLSYWELPPAAQAAHIVLATLVFSAQFYLMLNLYRSLKGGVQTS